jgi:D-glycero-alpha-D-manno-heptose-7-phosphate kinase
MPKTSPCRILVARAPTRIDFGGGWTDVPPYSLREGGCVCNVAISLYATARLAASEGQSETVARHADLPLATAALQRAGMTGIDAELVNDFPVAAGLGGSSAASIAMLGALDRWQSNETPLDRGALAEASRELEVRDLGIAGGRQDHYVAAFGGALGLWFGEATTLRRIRLSPDVTQSLARRCVVAYTGQSRMSADTVSGVMSAYERRERGVVESLGRMKNLATAMIDSLERGNIDDLGQLVGEHWSWQRSLHPAIPTPQIDSLLSTAMAAGALGGKALGASGGGCVLAIAPEGGEQRVRDAIRDYAQLLDYRLDTDGFSWEIST